MSEAHTSSLAEAEEEAMTSETPQVTEADSSVMEGSNIDFILSGVYTASEMSEPPSPPFQDANPFFSLSSPGNSPRDAADDADSKTEWEVVETAGGDEVTSTSTRTTGEYQLSPDEEVNSKPPEAAVSADPSGEGGAESGPVSVVDRVKMFEEEVKQRRPQSLSCSADLQGSLFDAGSRTRHQPFPAGDAHLAGPSGQQADRAEKESPVGAGQAVYRGRKQEEMTGEEFTKGYDVSSIIDPDGGEQIFSPGERPAREQLTSAQSEDPATEPHGEILLYQREDDGHVTSTTGQAGTTPGDVDSTFAVSTAGLQASYHGDQSEAAGTASLYENWQVDPAAPRQTDSWSAQQVFPQDQRTGQQDQLNENLQPQPCDAPQQRYQDEQRQKQWQQQQQRPARPPPTTGGSGAVPRPARGPPKGQPVQKKVHGTPPRYPTSATAAAATSRPIKSSISTTQKKPVQQPQPQRWPQPQPTPKQHPRPQPQSQQPRRLYSSRKENTSRTVQVTGDESIVEDTEYMVQYFENSRRSGGGKIISVDRRPGMILITFAEQKVAEAVLQRSHNLDDSELIVKPYEEPEPTSKIKVKGLPANVTKSRLQVLLESKGNAEVDWVKLMSGEAVVSFVDSKDVEAILSQHLSIQGTLLTLEALHDAPPLTSAKTTVISPPSAKNTSVSPTSASTTSISPSAKTTSISPTSAKTTSVSPTSAKAVSASTSAKTASALKTSAKAVRAPVTSAKTTSSSPTSAKSVSTPSTSAKIASVSSAGSAGSSPTTVEVTGISPTTYRDDILFYFENRRSGGGDVADVKYQPGSGVALVTFEESEVVPRVLNKQHSLDQSPLKVKVHSPETSSSTGQPKTPATVRVQGLSRGASADTLYDYFENRRRSGGGEVVDVQSEERTGGFYVTFREAEDAARVASRQHSLHDQELEVSLCEPPALYTDRLLLGNLPQLRTAEELIHFVEAKTKAEVKHVCFSEEEDGVAVVVFETDVDQQKVKDSLAKQHSKWQAVTVEAIPVSNTVVVTDLPQSPPVMSETLIDYFENRRSSGGQVTNVEMGSHAEYALVTFADADVAARVADRQHKIQGQPVSVSIYMERLGIGGGSDEPTVTLPQPYQLPAVQAKKLLHLRHLTGPHKAFEDALKNCHAGLDEDSESGSVSVVCLLSASMEDVRQLAKAWSGNVESVLKHHLEDVQAECFQVMPDESTEVENAVQQQIADLGGVVSTYNAGQRLFTLVYKGGEVRLPLSGLNATINDAKNKVQRKKKEVTKYIKYTKVKMLLLEKRQVKQELLSKYPLLVITFNDDCVELTGVEEEIMGAKIHVHEIMSSVVIRTHAWDSDLLKRLLQRPAARATLESLCQEQGPDSAVEFLPDGFQVCSFSEEQAEVMQTTVLKAIQRRAIPLDDSKRQAIELEGWRELKNSILLQNEELMVMGETESSWVIWSVTSSESIQKDYSKMLQYLEEHGIQCKKYSLPGRLHKLFKPVQEEKVLEMQLPPDLFEFDTTNDQVLAHGNQMCLEVAEAIFGEFVQRLCELPKCYKFPSMLEFFEGRDWARKQEEIEGSLQCLVLDPEEVPVGFCGGKQLSVRHFLKEGARQQPVGGGAAVQSRLSSLISRMTGSLTQSKPDVPARPRIYLSIMSDITKEEHKVLVNSTNPQLKLNDGQVSVAMLKVGGPGIQEQCNAIYPQGIKMGDVAVTDGFKLMCKKIFHCTLPGTKDARKIQKVIRETVMKCMEQADKLKLGSIGFPALGTGNLSYPADLVASTLYAAALDYGRQHPDTIISDIFFILHKKDKALTQIFQMEDEKYKQQLRDTQLAEPDLFLTMANPSAQGIESHPHFEETSMGVEKVLVGLSMTDLESANKQILACYKESVHTLSEDVEHLCHWNDLHKQNMIAACRAAGVDLTFNFTLRSLKLCAFRENLSKIKLHEMIQEAEREVVKQHKAAVLAQQVQWCSIEVDAVEPRFVPYSEMNNYEIETAYQDGRNQMAIIAVENNTNIAYIIDFTKMEQIPEDPSSAMQDTLTVMRRNKIQSQDLDPPKNWSNMGGRDLDCVRLDSSSSEFFGVADDFKKSLGNPAVQIMKIERIQNLTLYKQYQAMKQQVQTMMPDSKPCEKPKLWHGTKESSVDGIIKYGFNRGYSDLAKCAYGHGAYFAATAEYSSRNEYAQATPSRDRNIFRCMVLVGEYTKGDQAMRTPPEKTPGGDRYNSTVDDVQNPQVFVTYSDIQAYPEYRIVFKDR